MNLNIPDLLDQLIKYINSNILSTELLPYFCGGTISLGFFTVLYKTLLKPLKTNVEIHLIIPASSIDELKRTSGGDSWKKLNNNAINFLFKDTRYFLLASTENSVNIQKYLSFSPNSEPEYKNQATYIKINLKIPHEIEICKEKFDTFKEYTFSDIHIKEHTYLNNLSGLNEPIIIGEISKKFERVL